MSTSNIASRLLDEGSAAIPLGLQQQVRPAALQEIVAIATHQLALMPEHFQPSRTTISRLPLTAVELAANG